MEPPQPKALQIMQYKIQMTNIQRTLVEFEATLEIKRGLIAIKPLLISNVASNSTNYWVRDGAFLLPLIQRTYFECPRHLVFVSLLSNKIFFAFFHKYAFFYTSVDKFGDETT